MTQENFNLNDDGLLKMTIDPEVLAKELAAELQGDPLDDIDLDALDSDQAKVANDCEAGLKWLQQGHEERLQGLRVFCEHRDPRSLPLLVPLLSEPCPVERMSAVYALGRNPSARAVNILLELLEKDENAYVRKAAAWSLGNYSNAPVMKPLINSLKTDIAAVRLWAASSLAEVGLSSTANATEVVTELLISLKIDDEPVVRSNCIWSLGRLYELISENFKVEFMDALIFSLLNDSEASVRDEARVVLEQIDTPEVQARVKLALEERSLF
ncbi:MULTISPECIES: HEAT repeat domain-containing protein [Prochlorococcus]|uniref:HEAT repeat domain-containing protein n=1 Tax=Prochlorococcus TaxID=1218 RepID=UPI000533973D|nr:MULTISPECIES: HEAT repeat domain-containing protein [Prochlorococcus]KGG13508.1 HEAT repeat [Prochlorococcus sp. MIT 0601]